MTSTQKILRELIAIPSVNPAFLPARDPRAGEQGAAEYLAEMARRKGLEVEFREVFPGRSNILARLRPSGPAAQHVVLAPHLDTVGEPGLGPNLFVPRIKNGRLHGRGACDTKGSVAAMFSALLQLAQAGPRPARTLITFAGLIDEEHGQEGSRALVAGGFKADLAVVGEPTRLRMVTAHKGDIWLRLETEGKSAHGARPELGRNAIHAMARVVDLLETDYAELLKRRHHPLLGHPTINVGSIRGGSQPNIVPASCQIEIDRRTLPGETEPQITKEILSFLRAKGCRARLANGKHAACPPLETDPSIPLVEAFGRRLRQKAPVGVTFFCDAAVLAGGGTPSIVFGPGDIAQAHTADEWVSTASLEAGTEMLLGFLRSLP